MHPESTGEVDRRDFLQMVAVRRLGRGRWWAPGACGCTDEHSDPVEINARTTDGATRGRQHGLGIQRSSRRPEGPCR